VVHTVVVVTGTVVGVVVVGAGLVVVVPDEPEESDELLVVVGVVTETVVGVVVGVSSDSEELLVVVGTVVGTMTAGLAAPARYTTSAAETTPEPTRRVWVSRRTRANRRSRCWGVRVAGVKGFPHPPVLWIILKMWLRLNEKIDRMRGDTTFR
jgi:hypothetical protein